MSHLHGFSEHRGNFDVNPLPSRVFPVQRFLQNRSRCDVLMPGVTNYVHTIACCNFGDNIAREEGVQLYYQGNVAAMGLQLIGECTGFGPSWNEIFPVSSYCDE